MEEQMAASNGLFRKPGDLGVRTGVEGHPNCVISPLLQTGETGSLYSAINLNVIAPGGATEPHYHMNCPVFDHSHYVISGDLIATIAGNEQKVGPGTLIYCRSDELHSIKNIGTTEAKVLLISALPAGGTGGKLVFPASK